MTIKIYSASKLSQKDADSIAYIMAHSQYRDRDLANCFPQRFKRRTGNAVYLDLGKRRYCEQVKIESGDPE